MKKPYVILSSSISLDGYIDDGSDKRLLLSTKADFDRVDALRANCDAILVGANTIRKDNPRLLVRSVARQHKRIKKGLSRHPVKVTITNSGDLDPESNFFSLGDAHKIVYAARSAAIALHKKMNPEVLIVAHQSKVSLKRVLLDLAERGIQRILVEGGATINSLFLKERLADELHISIAGFFVGEKHAVPFVHNGAYPYHKDNRMKLNSIQMLDDIVVLQYLL